MSEIVDRLTEIIQDWRENGGSSSGCARAVLVAIREPTEAMVKAGRGGLPYDRPCEDSYRDMIDEALR